MLAPDSPPPILVFGPAYLDRVIRVDRPLLDPALGLPPLDRSVDGRWVEIDSGGALRLVDPTGAAVAVAAPTGWPGPVGTIAVSRPFADGVEERGPTTRLVRATRWADDLGGMGAGFAASLGGTLVSALGPEDDPTSRAIVALLDRAAIPHEPIRCAGHPADWTLLISSGPHGDKLPIGFRGCHAALTAADLERWEKATARVRVVAGLPNRVARVALTRDPRTVRAFFPNSRNMRDRADPVAAFADRIDLFGCNSGEWRDLGAAAGRLDDVPVVAITDGARGATVRFRAIGGGRDAVTVPAFPRRGPILDTNRAGEAFAATLLATLLTDGWAPSIGTDRGRVEFAAARASAAAALVLGRDDFGFATAEEIDEAVARGTA